MEPRRLKTITILILAMLNIALLMLLFHFLYQRTRSEQSLREQLFALYDSSSISLSEEDLSLDQAAPSSLTLSRDLELEAQIAAFLLEETAEGVHQGGGIYTYTGRYGTVSFRSNGSFDYAPSAQSVSSPADFCESFCETFGYEEAQSDLSGGSGSFSAQRWVDGTLVYNCTLSFLFERGRLVSLSGSCLSTADSSLLPDNRFTAVDALVKFLDFRNSSGIVCNTVTDVTPVYELQATTALPLQLTAKWQVSTDTYQYYVDCSTGDITRS